MNKRNFTLSLLISLFSLAVQAQSAHQPFNKAKMDSLFTTLDQNNKGMGSLALLHDGQLVYTNSIGYRVYTPEEKKRADADTRYRIGSVSKMFTSAIIFQLIEEKKLSLETKLDKYFPGIPNAKKITIAQMLNHHSGIHDFTQDSVYGAYMEKPQTQKEMLEHILAGKPAFEPGAKGEYSNSNYVLLGYIIEKICAKPYADVLQERIVQKLKLKNTSYGEKIDPNRNESFSYIKGSDWEQQPETDMSIPHGAGAVVSSPADLTLFITALFDQKLVSEKSLKTMMTLQDRYGMGMFSFPFGNKNAYGHTGQIDAFGTMLAYFPDEKLAIAYCSNGEVTSTNEIMIGVLSIYFNQPYNIPTYKKIELASSDLDQYLGVYASKEIPLKITITKENVTLMAQGTGQPAFPLDATDNNTFGFEPAGVVMRFDPSQKQFVLEQGGKKYSFVKE